MSFRSRRRNILLMLVVAFAWGRATAQQWYTLHGQATVIMQGHPGFGALYTGATSVQPEIEGKTSLTATLFAGARLWNGGAFYLNPEITGGTGISGAHGLAGFTNGETFRIGDPRISLSIARAYLQQEFDLGGGRDTIADDVNQCARTAASRRLTIIAGKFGIADFFDNNAVAHDPRTQFLNWAIMDAGAWDYPADTRGYTWGVAVEYRSGSFAARAGAVLEPDAPNGMTMDTRIAHAHGLAAEGEYTFDTPAFPVTVRALVFHNTSYAASYRQALDVATGAPDLSPLRTTPHVKYGAAVNADAAVTEGVIVFARASWNDGATETWAFTEIDRSLAIGTEAHNAAAALCVNGLSGDHRAFLAAGGSGFMIGDGRINYSPETILELYYRWTVYRGFALTPDYQFVVNPAYNADRGPIHVLALRLHCSL